MLIHGNNLDELPKLADASIDAIITDPPYELGFMGKTWDATGIAYNTELWRQCLRVIKPGGHLLAFGGSRTYHRLACAIEDAGFQIRDQIMWVYGSGFPKSLDVSKAIDKQAGAQREVISTVFRGANAGTSSGIMGKTVARTDITTAPASDAAKQWEGWGTALKPAHEPIVLARKPLDGTVANNVLVHGTGGINIDGCRVEGKLEGDPQRFAKTDGGSFNSFTRSTPVVRTDGRFPANLIHDGSDEVLELFPDTAGGKHSLNRRGATTGRSIGSPKIYASTSARFDTMTGYDDSGSAARFFYCAKASKTDRNEGLDDFQPKRDADRIADDGVGGANPRNRTNTAKVNHHPTVKPVMLMRYLCRLITPPGGTILDPFTGSGSTGKAAILEGFTFIGIELDPEYITIAQARINHAYTQRH